MPRTRKDEAPVLLDLPEIEGRHLDRGDCTVPYETFRADTDPAPLFHGLPDDRCQRPHWGIVQSGGLVGRYADPEEIYGAGDAYYAAPGHLPLTFAGTEVVEFSPTGQLQATMAVLGANLAAREPLR